MDDTQKENLVKLAVLGGAGFAAYEFGYKPYARRKELERITAAAIAANLSKGLSLEQATANAIGGACTVAAKAAGVPAAGAVCQGVGVLATKGIMLAGKGAAIVGKGTVAAAKAVGKVGATVGKGVAKGTVAVAYKAPKAVIGGTVNKTDQILSAVASKLVPKAVLKVIPKPVKQVAKVTKKVVKKVLCLGIFCGLDGIDDAATLAYLEQIAPQRHTRRMLSKLAPGRANPMDVHARSHAPRAAAISRATGRPVAGNRPAGVKRLRLAAGLGGTGRRGLPGRPPGRSPLVTGASFYNRHL